MTTETHKGVGEIAQLLKTLYALPEDLSLGSLPMSGNSQWSTTPVPVLLILSLNICRKRTVLLRASIGEETP